MDFYSGFQFTDPRADFNEFQSYRIELRLRQFGVPETLTSEGVQQHVRGAVQKQAELVCREAGT